MPPATGRGEERTLAAREGTGRAFVDRGFGGVDGRQGGGRRHVGLARDPVGGRALADRLGGDRDDLLRGAHFRQAG